jgi:hypothetical protein
MDKADESVRLFTNTGLLQRIKPIEMKKTASLLPVVLLGLLGGPGASGQVINVGNHSLLPNTAGQTIAINVSGGSLVQGLNFNVQVADGFPSTTPPKFPTSSVDGPNITGVNIIGTVLNPTIFFGNNTGQNNLRTNAQLWSVSTTTVTGTVNANGLLGILTIDTTGWFGGTWTLALRNTQEGPTDFTLVSATITDGSITVVPEPISTLIAGVLLLVGGLICRIRKTVAH